VSWGGRGGKSALTIARVGAVLLTILSCVLASRVRLSHDLTDLFPSTPHAHALARFARAFGGGDVGLVLIRGAEPDEVRRASQEAAASLARCQTVSHVLAEAPALSLASPTGAWQFAGPVARAKLARAVTEQGMRERIRETRALLLAPGASELEELVARDPLRLAQIPWEGRIELAAGARATPGTPFVSGDGRARLLLLHARGGAFDGRAATAFVEEVEGALAGTQRSHPGVTIEVTGGHAIARQTEQMVRGDLERSGVLSLVLAAVAFAVCFRRLRALVAVFPPLLLGTLWTTAIAGAAYERLSAVAVAFTAVVVGVGVDTGVHVYASILEARAQGLSPADAAREARARTWRPTLGAAVAAAGAFSALGLASVPGMRQLGLLCGAGEVLTALAILLVVPEVGAWLERGAPPPPLTAKWMARPTSTRGRSFVVAALALALVLASGVLGVPKLAGAVVALRPAALPALATYDSIHEIFGSRAGQLIVLTEDDDLDTALARADAVAEVAEELDASGAIGGFDALGTFRPSPRAQRARMAERDALELPSRAALLERVLREEGLSVDAFGDALRELSSPTRELFAPPDGDAATAFLRARHVATDGGRHVVATFVRPPADPSRLPDAVTTLRAADPRSTVTSFTELDRELKATLAHDMPRILAVASAIVLFTLVIALRSARAAVIAGAVLLVEMAIVHVVTHVFGVRWHVYDALVLPVLLGITLDEVLFLLDASARHRSLEDAIREQGPLASTTALTTAAGFAALAPCRFQGIADLGIVGALGSVAGLACAVLLVPALVRLWRPSGLGKRAAA
jgi:uncharacterized protein